MSRALRRRRSAGDALGRERRTRFLRKALGEPPRLGNACGVEDALERRLAHRDLVGEPHAEADSTPASGWQKMCSMPSASATCAGMLAARATETLQGIARHVVAACHRDALDRVRHAADGDPQGARRDLLAADGAARSSRSCAARARRIATPPSPRSSGCSPVGTEDFRKVLRLNTPEQHVRIGDRQRAAAAITGGPRIGARRFRAHPQARPVEADDGSPARRDAMNAHHGSAHAHARHFGIERALVLARVVTHIGRRAAHVESDQPGVSGRARALRPCRRCRPPGPTKSHPCPESAPPP